MGKRREDVDWMTVWGGSRGRFRELKGKEEDDDV